jgi:hypothetical protein
MLTAYCHMLLFFRFSKNGQSFVSGGKSIIYVRQWSLDTCQHAIFIKVHDIMCTHTF